MLEAVGAGVLESDLALLLHDGVGSGLDLVNGEEFGCGHTACERENLGLVGESEKLTNCGTLEKVHSA